MVPVNGHGGDASDLGMPTVASSFIRTDMAWGPGTGARSRSGVRRRAAAPRCPSLESLCVRLTKREAETARLAPSSQGESVPRGTASC